MYYHILFTCPKLGLYKESKHENFVIEELRVGIVKQLEEMPLEKFKKYCEIREYNIDVMDEKQSIPLNKQEFIGETDFK